MFRILTMSAAAICIGTAAIAQETVEVGSDSFGEAVRAYLLENPEVIFEAVDVFNARAEKAAAADAAKGLEAHSATLLDVSTGIVIGNPDASFSIIEFSDYNCGYCKQAHDVVNQLVADDTDVNVIIRHFPILAEGSFETAQVAMAIFALEGNETAAKFHDLVFQSDERKDMALAMKISTEMGLDADAISTQVENEENNISITQSYEVARELGVEGTPGFIIGNEILGGFAPLDAMKTVVADQRNK